MLLAKEVEIQIPPNNWAFTGLRPPEWHPTVINIFSNCRISSSRDLQYYIYFMACYSKYFSPISDLTMYDELFYELYDMEIDNLKTKKKGKNLRKQIHKRLLTIKNALAPLQGLGDQEQMLETQMWDCFNPLAKLQNVGVDALTSRLPAVDTIMNTSTDVLGKMKEILDKAQTFVSPSIWSGIKELTIALAFALYTRTMYPIMQACVSLASTKIGEYLKILMENNSVIDVSSFSSHISMMLPGLETQDDSFDFSALARIMSAAIAAIAAVVYGMPILDYKAILDKLSLVGRAAQGATNFNTLFTKCVDFVEEVVGKWRHGSNYANIKLKKQYPYLELAMDILIKFRSDGKAREILGANRSACKLLRWSYQHICSSIDAAFARRQTELVIRLKDLKRDLSSLNLLAETLLYSNCRSRVAPVVLFLHGEAGTGKTQVLEMLCKELSHDFYGDVPTDVLKFARKAETEYWDGYRPEHKIVTYDDIFQIVDSSSRPNPEVMEIIRVANSESYQLHMSAVEDKNNTFFNADYVFATSNASSFTPRSISCPDALARRFDLKCETKTKAEYGRIADAGEHLVPDPRKIWKKQNPGKTDAEMLQHMSDGTFIVKNDPCVYEFEVSYTYYGEKKTETLGYQELYDLIKAKRIEKINAFETEAVPLQTELDPDLEDLRIKLMVAKGFTEDDQFLDCEDNVVSRMYQTASKFVGNIRNTVDVRSLIDPSWDKFVKIMSRIGGVMTLLTLAGVGWQYFTRCNLRTAVVRGASINTVLETKLCSCKFCNEVKSFLTTHRFPNRFVPRDTVRETLALLARVCMNHGVQMSGAYHFIDIPILTHSKVDVDFQFFSGNTLKTWQRTIESESYQDKKIRNVNVESYQDRQIRNVNAESYQDKRIKNCSAESYQDKKVKPVQVESYQNVKIRDNVVESYQERNARTVKVEDSSLDDVIDNLLTQASGDENTSAIVRKLFCKNLVKLRNPSTGASLHGLFVRGTWLLVNRHFVNYVKNGQIQFQEFGHTKFQDAKIVKTHGVSRDDVDVDLMMIKLDAGVQARPDITGNFPTKSELSQLKGRTEDGLVRIIKSTTLKLNNANGEGCLIPTLETAQNVRYRDCAKSRHSSGEVYYLRQNFEATANTEKGDCGAPYVLFNPSCRAKILGIHAAGSAGYALAAILTKEDLTTVVSQDSCPCYDDLELSYDSILPNTWSLGSVKGVSNPTKSKIRPSGLFGVFEVKKAPAVLYDRDEDIMLKNTLKVTKQTTLLDEDLLDICQLDIQKQFKYRSDDVRRLLTHEESIKGIDGKMYMNSVNAHTSAGYPYVLNRGAYPGKTKWLGVNGEFRTDDIELRQHVERIESMAKVGVFKPYDGIFLASLKDERRELAKVEAKKTRVFAASNLGLSLAVRKYFLGFLQNIMTNRIDNEIGLGVNVYSLDWQRIVNLLSSKGDNIVAGDFSNFDGSLNSQILDRICDVVTAWYGDAKENGLTRKTIFNYLFRSAWLLDGRVIQLNHSQPSGNPLTTMINCLYNMFIFRYVYLLAQKQEGLPQTLVHYRKNVAAVYYGDDSILSIQSNILKWFNQMTITNLMAMTGHVYTDETKVESQVQCKKLSECTFLKRGFVKIDGHWAAPLSVDTIRDMIMWRKEGNSDEEAIIETTRQASFEAFFHGVEFFDTYTSIVMEECNKRGLVCGIVSYPEARNFWLSQLNSALTDDELINILYTV